MVTRIGRQIRVEVGELTNDQQNNSVNHFSTVSDLEEVTSSLHKIYVKGCY